MFAAPEAGANIGACFWPSYAVKDLRACAAAGACSTVIRQTVNMKFFVLVITLSYLNIRRSAALFAQL
jgi:hypothetical protein